MPLQRSGHEHKQSKTAEPTEIPFNVRTCEARETTIRFSGPLMPKNHDHFSTISGLGTYVDNKTRHCKAQT